MKLTTSATDLAGVRRLGGLRGYRLEEVAQHKSEHDAWAVFMGKVRPVLWTLLARRGCRGDCRWWWVRLARPPFGADCLGPARRGGRAGGGIHSHRLDLPTPNT